VVHPQARNRHRGLYAYTILMIYCSPICSCLERCNKERTNIEGHHNPVVIVTHLASIKIHDQKSSRRHEKCERPSVVLIHLARFLGGGKSCFFKMIAGFEIVSLNRSGSDYPIFGFWTCPSFSIYHTVATVEPILYTVHRTLRSHLSAPL
jgi:hypothetical protein